MSSIAIQAFKLSKIYRLYTKPLYRFLDMFGFLRRNNGYYAEYPALGGIDLCINRGEKVAIIGRNGAGKSTFLKIVSRIIEPTEGKIVVNGQVHALLSIGAGFHPDFTGRENVYSYLEHMGVSGSSADLKVEEIINFAEIEEYIDQPIKTYSTGMGTRLMFSASTAIAPDILIIDEVLGVGDAYFTKKSFDRMKDLCEKGGTTLLLVTHDVYAASSFCDRMVWIDRGRIIQDGQCDSVVQAYEASIRLQEEERLRQKTIISINNNINPQKPDLTTAYFQLVTENRGPVEKNLPIHSIKLRDDDRIIDEICMKRGASMDSTPFTGLVLTEGESNWGNPYERNGKWFRDFQTFGSIFQRAPFIFKLDGNNQPCSKKLTIEISVLDTIKQPCYLELHGLNDQTLCHSIEFLGDNLERTYSVSFGIDMMDNSRSYQRPEVIGLESQKNIVEAGKQFGSKRLVIQSVSIIDDEGQNRLIFKPNENLDIEINFQVIDPNFNEKPTMMIALHREGATIATRLISQKFLVNKKNDGNDIYSVKVKQRPCLLGPGVYSVVIGLYEQDYFKKCHGRHFAENQMVLDKLNNASHFEIKSRNDDWNYYLLEYIQPAEWSVE